MNAYNFTTKSEYLAATAQWKTDYVIASQNNRDARRDLKLAQHNYSKDSSSANFIALGKAERQRATAKYESNQLLEARGKMKKEAQRQYALAKEVIAS